MGIMLSQNCGKIPVGDPHQQIYTFRGAVNALHAVPHTHIYYLTQSFRFGSEIAYIGAAVLDSCKKVKQVLVGGNQDGGVRGEDTQTLQHLKLGQRLPEGSVAILSRCNVTVFSEAVRLTDVNPTILKMGGFRGLKGYAMASEDCEPELVKCIYDHAQKSPVCADFILGTVHKAKSLEFDTVVVTDDFMKVPCARHILQRVGGFNAANVPDDEWNLLYVAITRAKRALYITKTISNILTFTGEYFLRSGLTSTLLSKNPSLVCSIESCENHITADAVFSMSKLPIRYLFELSF